MLTWLIDNDKIYSYSYLHLSYLLFIENINKY